MERVRRIPRYPVVVGGLLLVVMAIALAQGNAVGVILATVLGAFVGAPALVIWLHERHAPTEDQSRASGAERADGDA